jgi:hypothetical protein
MRDRLQRHFFGAGRRPEFVDLFGSLDLELELDPVVCHVVPSRWGPSKPLHQALQTWGHYGTVVVMRFTVPLVSLKHNAI